MSTMTKVLRRLTGRGVLRNVVFAAAAWLAFPSTNRADVEASGKLPIVVARNEKTVRERLERNVAEIITTYSRLGVLVPVRLRNIIKATEALSDYQATGAIQIELDNLALLSVGLSDEAWFTVLPASPRPADRPLVKGQWKTFLVKVDNGSRVTSPLAVRSPQAIAELVPENESLDSTCFQQPHGWSQWFLLRMIGPPLMPSLLSGQEVEYFVMQICSLEEGVRAAELTFYLGGGQVSQGHYGSLMLVFQSRSE
jgi:hypothetical protein